MDKEAIETYLDSLKGAEGSYPFGPEVIVYKVSGKMFAWVSQDEDPARVTFKCLPEDASLLVGQYESIVPGYHMNKKHWITITLESEVSSDMLMALADDSYELVVAKLTRKQKALLASL